MPSIAAAEVPFGVAAGAALGAFAGPPGMIAGAVIGAGVGGALAIAQNVQTHRESETTDLYDEELGIIGGELGVPHLRHPPATVGAYSAASAGISTGDASLELAEGPFQPPGA